MHLREAYELEKLKRSMHRWFKRRPRRDAKGGGVGRRPASGGAACGSGRNKREVGIIFSPHVEALAEERAAGKTATTKIDAGGPSSKGGDDELDWAHGNRRGRLGSSV
jgi:hypothetical protein